MVFPLGSVMFDEIVKVREVATSNMPLVFPKRSPIV